MQQIKGVGVSAGRSVGPLVRMPDPISEPSDSSPLDEADRDAAAAAISDAAASVKADLEARAASASAEGKALLEATAMMAADPTLVNGAKKKVTAHGTVAPRAVWEYWMPRSARRRSAHLEVSWSV